MAAGRYALRIEQGASFETRLTWSKDGEAIDMSGYSAALEIRDCHDALIYAASNTNGRIYLDGTSLWLRFPDEDTNDLAPGSHRYDLELSDEDGNVTRLLEGSAFVTPQVTES